MTLYHSSPKINKFKFFKSILSLPLSIRILGFIASITLVVSTFFIGVNLIDKYFFVSVPKHGGVLNEGVIGRPRLINPVVSKTEVDRDLSSLIYSSLFKPNNNTLEPDAAESFEISEDGKVYTVTLKDGITFHDGMPLTAADVIFTVERIQNKGLPVKSPLAPNFNGVNATSVDDKTIIFSLDKPHATFLETLTFGILPKHIWEPVGIADFDQTNYNIEPIGSGPYKFKEIVRNSKNGLATKYALTSFENYIHGEPFIENLNIYFYGSEDDRASAFNDSEITQIAGVQTFFAKELESRKKPIITAQMPRIFGVYLNQEKNSILGDDAIRKALDLSMPREKIINEVFNGYAESEESPFPGMIKATSSEADARFLTAEALLEKNGWKKNDEGFLEKTKSDKKSTTVTKLQLSISLPDIPELTTSAQIIKEEWNKLGVNVELKTFDLGTFTSDILTSRNFEAALFGQVTGRDPDPFSFWHSSQKTNGMNIAQYASKSVDDNIMTLAKTFDISKRAELLTKISKTIRDDRPALFTYSPKFIYVVDKNLSGVNLPLMTTASERFSHIEDWYVTEERTWKFLSK